MKYFDDIKRAKTLLYVTGILGLSLSAAGLLVVRFASPDSVLTHIINPSVTDDMILFFIMLLTFPVNLICGFMYARLRLWVWYSVYWVNVTGAFIGASFFVLYVSELMTAYYFTLFAAGVYALLCFGAYWYIHDLKIKAIFKKWEG